MFAASGQLFIGRVGVGRCGGRGGVVEMTDVIATANHNNITANLGIFAVT